MQQGYDNSGELNDFVTKHKLSNMYSVTRFKALVSIKTVKNKIVNEEMEVGVEFSGYNSYGTLTLFENHLDYLLYPTIFEAKWGKMMHIDNEHFYITDTHPTIGKYEVKIIPLRRLMD